MTTDATQVTGSPLADHEVARRGDVLAERYELLEVLDADGPSIACRAVDQESERSVLVRVLAGPGLPERTLGEVLERLRALVGVGGRYLSPLLDADREGKRPFTVEAWPAGTRLSAIFVSRRMRAETLGAREVLPLVARIAAGLAAIPDPWHHGDVRAERVWVDTDGVRLTGAFLLAALPPPALRERIEGLGPGALAYAPEVAAGRLGASADRWGLAAIAWEALTGRAPELASHPPELSTPLRAALLRLLDPEPGRRAKDVSALLDAVARHAGLDVPEIDPEPHRPPGADVGRPPRSVPPPVRRRIEGAAEEGTQEITFDQILAGRAIESDDDALDPDLVAAALADDTARHAPVDASAPDLDPRLVRAALGVTSDERSLEEPTASAVLHDEVGRGRPLPPVGSGSEGGFVEDRADRHTPTPALPRERGREPLGTRAIKAPPSAPPPARRLSQNQSERGLPLPLAGGGGGEVAAITDVSRPPHPSPPPLERGREPLGTRGSGPHREKRQPPRGRGSGGGCGEPPADRHTPTPALPGESGGGSSGRERFVAASRTRQPPSGGGSSGREGPRPKARAATGGDGGTAIVPRPVEEPAPPPPVRRSRLAGPLIVVSALLLAIAIVGLGFFIRARMTENERAREIHERLEQIRSADPGA